MTPYEFLSDHQWLGLAPANPRNDPHGTNLRGFLGQPPDNADCGHRGHRHAGSSDPGDSPARAAILEKFLSGPALTALKNRPWTSVLGPEPQLVRSTSQFDLSCLETTHSERSRKLRNRTFPPGSIKASGSDQLDRYGY